MAGGCLSILFQQRFSWSLIISIFLFSVICLVISQGLFVAGGCLSFLFQLPTKIFLVISIFLFSVLFVVISTFLVWVAVVEWLMHRLETASPLSA